MTSEATAELLASPAAPHGSGSLSAVTGSRCSSITRIPLHRGSLPTGCVGRGWSSRSVAAFTRVQKLHPPRDADAGAVGSSGTGLLCAVPSPRLSAGTA